MDCPTKVSIIIPTYEEEKYIGSLLDRLSWMGFPLEIIVVDGGSEDRTVDIAKQFTGNVHVLEGRGIAKAKNYGAHKANGDILIFLDADVTPSLDLVEKVIEVFKDDRIEGATCNTMPIRPRLSEKLFFMIYNKILRFASLFKPHSRGEFIAVRRETFKKVGGFDTRLPCLEDVDFAFRVSRFGKFAFIADLTVLETMRRIRKLGLFSLFMTWSRDYLCYLLFKRTVSEEWIAIR